jgi:hypothetical protein
MTLVQPVAQTPKAMRWAGRIISAIPVLFLGVGGLFACFNPAQIKEGTAHLGYPDRLVPVVLALEIGCAVLYAVPQTAALGAILMTGYLGGAVASHVRVGEGKFVVPVVVGVLVWLGLFLRDARVRTLVPLRRPMP